MYFVHMSMFSLYIYVLSLVVNFRASCRLFYLVLSLELHYSVQVCK